jgi:hypothetical protein
VTLQHALVFTFVALFGVYTFHAWGLIRRREGQESVRAVSCSFTGDAWCTHLSRDLLVRLGTVPLEHPFLYTLITFEP